MTLRFRKKGSVGFKVVEAEEIEVKDFGICEANGDEYKFREMDEKTYTAEELE